MRMIFRVTGSQEVRAAVRSLGRDIPKVVARRAKSALGVARHKLRSEAGIRISYPVQWDSERQRRAFFATKGFGRGIPTGRSGGYQKGWEVTEQSADFALQNRYPGAVFIGGDVHGRSQSRIHRNRWLLFSTVIESAKDEIRKQTMPDIVTQAKKSGFK